MIVMMTPYERVRARLDEVHPGMSDREASLKATGGKNADLLRTMKQGRSSFPRGANLQGLADLLQTSVDWLTKEEGEPDDTIGARIKFARKLRGLTQDDVAAHFKISRVSVAQWEGRANSPQPDKIPELARLLTTTTDWLISGSGRPPAEDDIRDPVYEPVEAEGWQIIPDQEGEGYYDREHYTPKYEDGIPELDARAGGGEGAVGEVMVLPLGVDTISSHKIVDEWRIPPAYLREAVPHPDRAIVLPVQGDSMMPNYAPGDRVIIDLSEHELRVDGVYLISDGLSEPQIKRLQRIMFTNPPMCRIVSDNPAYEAQEVALDGLHIMGKVAAYVGRR